MLRIKSKIGSDQVYTLTSKGKWITISTINGVVQSVDAIDMFEAGKNHLFACQEIKKFQQGK